MILVESNETLVDLLSSAGTFSRDTLGVLKCTTIVSVHNLFLIPFFNCVLSDRVKFLSYQCLFL